LRIGIHTSTAGSLEKAAIKANELGANTFQIFSASPRMWRTRTPDPERIKLLNDYRAKHDLTPLVIHGSYLINLGAPPSLIRERSIEAFSGELERALLIGAEYLVIHPGSYKSLTVEGGMGNVAEGLARAWRTVDRKLRKHPKLKVLLENTAGAGAQLGGNLQELATIRELATPHLDISIGYCLDTCHCYVSGFDLASQAGFQHLVETAAATLGLEHVPVFHANDAKAAFNSHRDRHAHIGAGYIGLEGFRRILNHPDLREKAFILETPIDQPGDDLRNVKALKELVFQKRRSTLKKSSRSGTNNGRRTRPST
jgi:deoxyribonuclease IV